MIFSVSIQRRLDRRAILDFRYLRGRSSCTYSAALQGARLLVDPFPTQGEAVLLRCFLAVKDRPLDAFDLHNRSKTAWTKDSSLRVPLKSGCKGRDC